MSFQFSVWYFLSFSSFLLLFLFFLYSFSYTSPLLRLSFCFSSSSPSTTSRLSFPNSISTSRAPISLADSAKSFIFGHHGYCVHPRLLSGQWPAKRPIIYALTYKGKYLYHLHLAGYLSRPNSGLETETSALRPKSQLPGPK